MAKEREYYNNDLKWNIKDLYINIEKYNEDMEFIDVHLEDYKKYKDHILDSPHNLYELLDFDNEINKKLEQVYIYAHIQNDQDTTDPKFQTMFGKTYKLFEKYSETTAFIGPEILKGDYKTINNYISSNPKLKDFERVLKELFKYKKYTLSSQEEQLMSSLNGLFNTSDDVASLLTDADLKFGTTIGELGQKQELTEKTYRILIESKSRRVRKSAFNKLFTTYGNFKNTYAKLLASEVEKNNKIASIRGYKSALAASLYKNDIPEEIYTNLIDTVRQNIAPLSRFWKLKKRVLGLNSFHIYDTSAPITDEITLKYTEKEAEELLLNSLSVLGSVYINDLKKAFTDKWIDFCPNKGKRNGAYCTACYNVHPYVLVNYDGSLNNVSTLAHELGHAMHYYYAIKNQSYQDYSYSIFVAEVASQVNQILLSKYLIANTQDLENKKYLIDDLIRDFKATIYRQTMFAEFERTIHELAQNGDILTHEKLSEIYYDLNKVYYGKNIVVDDVIKYEWARIPHFYMNFYVYQYATAYVAAIKIAMDILNQKENAVNNYLEFLKLGCTKTPIESLKIAGVDMTKSENLDEAFGYFADLVTELENLYKK